MGSCEPRPRPVTDMESDRDWDDVYNQHRFAQMASEAAALHQVVPLATGRTLGMTLRPRRGGKGEFGSG